MSAVRLAPFVRDMAGCGRAGTCMATLADLRRAFGAPTYAGSDDGKVTAGWIFDTPRGPAEVRDYWWNAPDEMSIGAGSRKAAMWLARLLRRAGLPASSRWHTVPEGLRHG